MVAEKSTYKNSSKKSRAPKLNHHLTEPPGDIRANHLNSESSSTSNPHMTRTITRKEQKSKKNIN
jgi:hypothetical protein